MKELLLFGLFCALAICTALFLDGWLLWTVLILVLVVAICIGILWVLDRKINGKYAGWITGSILAIILFAILPFHYLLDYGKVFPKEHFTFSNTFVTKDDIKKVVERYNNANFFEKQEINKEPLVRKLKEKGIIIDEKLKSFD